MSLGGSLVIAIPATICRELSIHRGDYFDLCIGADNIIIAQRIKIVRRGEFGEVRDPNLPVKKYE